MQTQYKKICILAIIYNEHPYLKEWIDWHMSLGINDFYLIEDYNSMSHKDIIDQYDNVHLIDIHSLLHSKIDDFCLRQCVSYKLLIKQLKQDYDWCLVIDVDEFLEFEDGYDLNMLLNDFNKYYGVLLYWKVYGANGYINKPDCGVQEAYKNENNIYDKVFNTFMCKSLYNLNTKFAMLNMHICIGAVNTDFKRSLTAINKTYSKAWLNHYYTKSLEEYKLRPNINNSRNLDVFYKINPNIIKNGGN